MNTYRVLLPLLVHTEDGAYAQGEEFDKDFSEEEETANLRSGLLELVPRRYKVLAAFDGHPEGEEVEAAIPLGREAQLAEGGFLERVEEKPAPKPRKKKKED